MTYSEKRLADPQSLGRSHGRAWADELTDYQIVNGVIPCRNPREVAESGAPYDQLDRMLDHDLYVRGFIDGAAERVQEILMDIPVEEGGQEISTVIDVDYDECRGAYYLIGY